MNKKTEEKNEKKPYKIPVIKEKDLTGHFMICSTNRRKCPPGTMLRVSSKCF